MTHGCGAGRRPRRMTLERSSYRAHLRSNAPVSHRRRISMSHVEAEIASQPECWARAAGLAGSPALPAAGERGAVVGCGTSWFMGKAYAALREQAGQGETDAFQASEFPAGRRYDRIVAI